MTAKYCIDAHNLPAHELIGLDAKVVKSADVKKMGLSGRIVDETKNMFEIEGRGRIMKIPKREVVMEFRLSGKSLGKIECSRIISRPEDRIKNFFKKGRGA